jgi:DNA-binding HxlR family transcriptional regulator
VQLDFVRHRFARDNCSIARALEILGDWWTLLIVREAFLGVRRFAEFAEQLPIARNVLTARLEHLVAHGVLARVDAGVHGTRYEYELTAMGKDLITTVTALRQWGDRWVFGEGREPVLVLDRRTGRPVPRLRIVDETGAPMAGGDLAVVPGPGASATTRARYQRRASPAAGRKTGGKRRVTRRGRRSRRTAAPRRGRRRPSAAR